MHIKHLILTILLFSTKIFAQPVTINMPSSTVLRSRLSYLFVSAETRREKKLSSDTIYLIKKGDKYFARLSEKLANKRLNVKEIIDIVVCFTKNTKNPFIKIIAWSNMVFILRKLVINSKEAFYELEEIEKNLEIKKLNNKKQKNNQSACSCCAIV